MVLLFSVDAFAMTAEEIIQRRDSNEYVQTAIVEAEMIIVNNNRKITKTMISYGDRENALTIFTNPDRGTKFLKRGDELWMFFSPMPRIWSRSSRPHAESRDDGQRLFLPGYYGIR